MAVQPCPVLPTRRTMPPGGLPRHSQMRTRCHMPLMRSRARWQTSVGSTGCAGGVTTATGWPAAASWATKPAVMPPRPATNSQGMATSAGWAEGRSTRRQREGERDDLASHDTFASLIGAGRRLLLTMIMPAGRPPALRPVSGFGSTDSGQYAAPARLFPCCGTMRRCNGTSAAHPRCVTGWFLPLNLPVPSIWPARAQAGRPFFRQGGEAAVSPENSDRSRR